ncbi:PREDICTED: olfactory receptor 6X1-like [Nanorana parkeri]|uniref:olfactory receptor 6X1-like n=1 Tax=Nanorana parkeri TaxID=125878 RepID=UPI000854F37E|nr:PREDICTED: olfactory receptor 6X1-like [Nanorana parkeri]
MQVKNTTSITEFHLLGFSLLTEVGLCLFIMVSIVYIVTIAANIFIIFVIFTEQRLHKPMYFFIGGLSFIEIWYPTVTAPTLLWALLMRKQNISLAGCMSQFYFHFSLGTTESFLLTVMSYDRYVAICNPLHYFVIMSPGNCKKLLISCWAGGFMVIVVLCLQVANLSYCYGNELDHYYCDFAALIKLSCSKTSSVEMLFFISACFVILGCFLLIVMSYIQIIRTTMSFTTSNGRRRTFSTCAAHLIVVCLFYVTNIFMFVRPTADDTFHLNKSVSIIPSVVTPLLNPIIYTLRNQEVKEAVKKAIQKLHF